MNSRVEKIWQQFESQRIMLRLFDFIISNNLYVEACSVILFFFFNNLAMLNRGMNASL